MTLLELLTVIAIVCLMLAFSAAAYWRTARDFREQGAASQVDILLRQARNSAVSANAPAYVTIDAENHKIVPYACRVMGLWHFEDRDAYGRTTGAHHNAVMRGAELFPDGKIGKCARLYANAYVDCSADPDFDCEDGGYLEAYIRPATYTFNGDSYVFYKNGSYDLKVGRAGRLEGDVGKVHVISTDYHIVPDRWTKVALAWDSVTTRVLADDTIVASGPGAKAPITEHPLLIGHESASLAGLVDEARAMSAIKGAALDLPKTFTVTNTATPWNAVYFAGDGSLDMRYHAGPVSITIEQDGRARSVKVSMLGETSRQEVEKIEKVKEPETAVDPAEAAAKAAQEKKRAAEQNKKIRMMDESNAANGKGNDDNK